LTLSDYSYSPDPNPAFMPTCFHVSLGPAVVSQFGALTGAELRVRLVKAVFALKTFVIMPNANDVKAL
jgi:hypothetical protein